MLSYVMSVLLLATTPVGTSNPRPSAAATSVPTVASQLRADVIRGIKALEFQGLVLSDEKRGAIADAIIEVHQETAVDPFLLVAVARMESDFVSVARVNYQCKISPRYTCSADCGITQHHVTGPGKYVQRYCTTLQKDFKLSFRKSAEELVRHVEWCSARSKNPWWGPLELCVLNRYNQGPYYRRDSECEKVGEPGQDRAARKELRRRCLIRAAYWKRVLCFHYGAAHGKTLVRSCRYTMNLKDIPWFYGDKATAYTSPLPVFKAVLEDLERKAVAARAAQAASPPRGSAN